MSRNGFHRQANEGFRIHRLAREIHFATSLLRDRKSTRLNSSHTVISYAVFCLKKKNHRQRDRCLVHAGSPVHPPTPALELRPSLAQLGEPAVDHPRDRHAPTHCTAEPAPAPAT